MRVVALLWVALWALATAGPAVPMPLPGAPGGGGTELLRIAYRAHDGSARGAVVLLPRGYADGPIPLVISPHGRGLTGMDNALLWGDLPGEGGFAVVNPDGEGRRLTAYSWGDPGQIADLARMPSIVERALPWLRIDRRRVYAIGGSMGGQETLLLVARDPRLLAGAAAFDPATDLARRFRDFAALPGGPSLRRLALEEVGCPPARCPAAWAVRSPDAVAAAIARSGVPLQVYWSGRDRIIRDQAEESQLLVHRLRHLGTAAPLRWFPGDWDHSAEMQATRRLPRALVRFGLLPAALVPALPA